MMMDVIFDFDYTLLPEESTVEVLKIALEDDPQQPFFFQKLAEIAPRALTGKATLAECLFMLKIARRVRRQHIQTYVERSYDRLLPVFHTLFSDLAAANARVHIVSGGYEEWIKPLAAEWGIPAANVVGNRFVWWRDRVIGLRPSPLWSSKKSKTYIIDAMRKQNKISTPAVIIGDSITDRNVWSNGATKWFIIAEYFTNERLADGERCYRATTPEQMCQNLLEIVG